MCLDVVLERYKKTDKVSGIGYKVFRLQGEQLMPDCRGGATERPKGVWLHEKNFRDYSSRNVIKVKNGDSTYCIGWHIFCTLRSAKKWSESCHRKKNAITKKVKYRDARVLGTQRKRKIVVAKEIFILKEA